MDALIKLPENERDEYPVIWALGEIGDQRAIPTLNRLLSSEDKYVRYNADGALAKIRTPHQVEDNSNTRDLLDIGRMAFKKYQEAMRVVFQKIAGPKKGCEQI
jgi:hypothetical protein